MHLGLYAVAVAVATLAGSFTDWYFMGVLFHDRYLAYPDTWRHSQGGKGERLAILVSTLFGLLTSAVFIGLAAMLGAADDARVFTLAVGVWLAVPLPLLVTNGLFIKIHPLNTLANALGWLARLLVCALSAWIFLR